MNRSLNPVVLVVLLLFAASGCSALIYEIIWYQLLQLAIGSTSVSLGILLATFMGGLCGGSIGLPRLRVAGLHPLRIYAALEVGIALCGILVLKGLPFIDRVYVAGAEHGLPGMLLRGSICALCLLPPTILMGASLPALVRWIEARRLGVSWWGLFYGGNTLGAVVGCLLAGFYLLRIYNMAVGTYAAVAINLAVALVSFVLAGRTVPVSPAEPDPFRTAESAGRWPVYLTIALSGACALGAEVVWTRLMGMMLGATVYVFSIILAVFLIGLALGSALGSWVLGVVRPAMALGWCQILLVAGIFWGAWMIADSLPYWPINPLLTKSPWFIFQLDLVRCLWAILPSTILWGASFPLACAAVASPGEDSGRLAGAVYAANTLGAIIGALAVSLALIPSIGTQQTQRALMLISAGSGLIILVAHVWRQRARWTALTLAVSLAVAGLLAYKVDRVPGQLIAYGRRMMISSGRVRYMAEGRNSSVAITEVSDGATEIDVNGHVEATTEPYDMKLQRMVGHLPGILHPNPKSVLGIGFGAGVSAGTFTRYPTIQKITVCEIEPIIPPISTRFFAPQNYEVLHNPRTRIVYDDARHYLLTTTDTFDIIASDPLDVFVKGTAGLYSKEYFEAVKRHLNPGGMFTLYVPLYESDERTVKSELATFFEAFPYGTVWSNTISGSGYDMVFLGQAEPLQIDLDALQQRLDRPDYAPVLESLRDIGVNSPAELLATFTGQKTDLAEWLKGAELNRDIDLRLQYLAGWGINSQLENTIYLDMLRYRRRPLKIFTGSTQRVQSLMAMLAYGVGAAQ